MASAASQSSLRFWCMKTALHSHYPHLTSLYLLLAGSSEPGQRVWQPCSSTQCSADQPVGHGNSWILASEPCGQPGINCHHFRHSLRSIHCHYLGASQPVILRGSCNNLQVGFMTPSDLSVMPQKRLSKRCLQWSHLPVSLHKTNSLPSPIQKTLKYQCLMGHFRSEH